MINKKFGHLIVKSFIGNVPVGKQGKKRGQWLCLCDCGEETLAYTGSLNSGKKKSCGCNGKYKNGQKKCSRCNEFLPLSSFGKKASACKICAAKRRKEIYNPLRARKQYLKITEEQKESRRKYARDKRNENPELANKRVREWRKNNPEYKKKRWKSDLKYRITENLRGRVYKAIKAQSSLKNNTTIDLVGCTIPELKNYIASKFDSKMSWSNYGEWHIDHIIPCSKFDLTDLLQQKLCFHYTNLQPLWAKDNLRKGAKILNTLKKN